MTGEPAKSSPRRGLSLATAVEELYAVFNRYTLDHPVTGCPCSTSGADDRAVRSKPLRQLAPADLHRFATKAVTTLGTTNDLKHFLPRLLELAALTGTVGGASFEIVLGKLTYAEWEKWPDREREAVRGYLAAVWRHVLSEFPHSPNADTCLCGIAAAESELWPYLDAWRADGSIPAFRHLAEFLGGNVRRLIKSGKLANAFWRGREGQMLQVMAWLLDPATAGELEQAFFRCDDPTVAGELSRAVDELGNLVSAGVEPS